MEIKGTTKYTPEIFRKFQRFHLTKNKALLVCVIIYEIGLLLSIVRVCLTGNFEENLSGLIFAVIMVLLIPFVYIATPWLASRNSKNFAGIENSFIFKEEGLTAYSKGSTIDSKAEMKYELFYRVYETSDCFYIYQTKRQAFILLKQDIEENKVDDLRELLTNKLPKNKYKKI